MNQVKRALLAPALAAVLLAAPLTAAASAEPFDITSMSEAEREAFRAEVRAYLLENPEIILEVIKVLEERQAQAQQLDEEALVTVNADEIFNDGHSWIGGNPEGDVTIVEFSDYRCPYCRKAHPEVEELLRQDGNIRLIYKEYPILGEASLTAARFAVATMLTHGPEAYRKINNALMEMRGEPTADALKAIAERLGLDAAEIALKMGDEEVETIIRKNQELGQRLRINGTPTFIIEDRFLRGYVPLEDMKAVVAEIRREKAEEDN